MTVAFLYQPTCRKVEGKSVSLASY